MSGLTGYLSLVSSPMNPDESPPGEGGGACSLGPLKILLCLPSSTLINSIVPYFFVKFPFNCRSSLVPSNAGISKISPVPLK